MAGMLDIDRVIEKFPAEIRSRFDFTKATYRGALTPITGIVCPVHGEFQQYAAQLRKNGATCPKCGIERRVELRRLDPEEFVSRASKVHAGKYQYGKTAYVNMTTKVVVTCPRHGDFGISPIKLIHGGQGCPACGSVSRGHRRDILSGAAKAAQAKRKKFREMFEERARAVHGDLYDYSRHGYVAGREKVNIVCRRHGLFRQAVYHHLAGQGCPHCVTKSAPEDEIAAYLAKFTKVERRNRTIIAPKELDIYLPDHRLAIEYCGMYWHSHGDADDEKKNKLRHKAKHDMCAAAGVRLITIYETDWTNHKNAMCRFLRNAVGGTITRLMARKCDLRIVDRKEAAAFYDRFHPQGGAGSGRHYGLYWKGILVACMRFAIGNNDRGAGAKDRVWTLSRYATSVTVAGAASRLFRAFLRDEKPDQVKSFSDNRLFEGGMYGRLGFVLEQEIDPDYQVWSQKVGLRPKSHYQRRVIQKRLNEHGIDERFDHEADPRTEMEMTYLMGARRIYDCGKKRWVWRGA